MLIFQKKYLEILEKHISTLYYIGDMTDTEEAVNNQLTKKINTANKNIKLLMEMVKALEEKLEALKASTPQTPEEKEKLNEIFEKKGLEKPKGNFQEKQRQYLRMLKAGKIREPKASTLDYYKIMKDDDGNYQLMVDALKWIS